MLCIVANNIALVATYILGKSVTEENAGDCAVVLPSKNNEFSQKSLMLLVRQGGLEVEKEVPRTWQVLPFPLQ